MIAALAVAFATPARAEPARYELRGEAGGEYDTNPGRTEEVDGAPIGAAVAPSPAGRLVLGGDVFARAGARHAFSLSLGLAGKLFARSPARTEDVLIAQGSAAWNVLVAGRTSAGLSASVYDVTQRRGGDARDFRSAAPGLHLDQPVGEGGQLSAGAGYRWFTYKPEPAFDFQGPTAFLFYRHALGGVADADWEWSGGFSGELRAFRGVRCTALDACPGPATAGARRDQFWMAHVEATRTSTFLLGAGLAADLNTSNSYGEEVVRGLAHLRAVVRLPADVLLSGRAELVAAWYRDPVPIRAAVGGTPAATIEDERRSTLRLEAVRPFTPHVDVGARYTLYTNELAAGPTRFRRHTLLLFAAFTVGP